MTSIDLGPRTKTAAADTTGTNAGNQTTTFTSQDFATNIPIFEIYKMIVTNVPAGGNCTIYHNNNPWSFTYPNTASEWDPSQVKQCRPSDQVDFRWNIASSGQKPITTIWLRWDPALLELYGAQ